VHETCDAEMNRIQDTAPYTLVLTHDIDVITLQEIPMSCRTFWGFPYRAVCANFFRAVSGDISLGQYLEAIMWSLGIPLIKMRVMPDPWYRSFQTMIEIERSHNVRSTLFLMTRDRVGGHVARGKAAPSNRSCFYRLDDWKGLFAELQLQGWELAVHGLDCHLSTEAASAEREVFSRTFGIERPGLRMHWLYRSPSLWWNAASAGYAYDSTLGWNDRIGFPEGRTKPWVDENSSLPILPLNVQDGAVLRDGVRADRGEDAWRRISAVIDKAAETQGVVTVLWHSNSFGPPRFWQDTYIRILERALNDGARILRAGDVVGELREESKP